MNFIKLLSIRTQLLILAISTGIVVILILSIIYVQVTNVISKNNDVYTDEMTFQIKQKITNNIDQMNRILTSVAYNSNIQNYLLETDESKKVELVHHIDNLLLNTQGMNSGIIDFVFLGNDGNSYYLKGRNETIEQMLLKMPDKVINYYSEKKVLPYNGTKRDCFMAITTIYSINPENRLGEKIGIAAIVFNANVLGVDKNKKLKETAINFYLLDRNNEVYSGNNLTTVDNLKNIDSKNDIVKKEEIPEIGGQIISIIPKKQLFQDLSWIRNLVGTILIVCGIFISVLFTVIINNILYPLNKLRAFIYSIKNGNLKGLKQRVNLGGYVEMGIMAGELNGMLDEIDNLTHRLLSTTSRLYEIELEKKKSELAFLRNQINPHFLYNTLETLKGMAIDEGALNTMGMAKALGQIFHYSVTGADLVALSDEFNIIKSYLRIQQIRFGERFDVTYDFVETIMDCQIPKMILQPIVENAIIHGLEEKLDKGHLWISGEQVEEGLLHIRIRDDGKGMDGTKLASLHAALSGNGEEAGKESADTIRIGIYNVHNRLRLLYGPGYGVEIESVVGKGTEVILKMPARGRDHV